MSSIPTHYSERYVNQRYNKALHIVQHLPVSSSFQPNKEQKLELYALYKQVSHGNIDTQRPGIFDVVGRAKWDAWAKLQGLPTLEAKHRYVETLLRVCAEAYRKPAAKAQVQQIIQAFATLRPTEDDDSDNMDDTDDDEDDMDAVATSESVDEEEKAYLMDIRRSVPEMTSSRSVSTITSQASDSYQSLRSPALRSSPRTKQRRSWHSKPPPPPSRSLRRAPSIESTQSMMTAPSAPLRRHSRSSSTTIHHNAAGMRPPSTISHRSDRRHPTIGPQQYAVFDEPFDDSINPWATNQDNRRYRLGDDSSDDSIDEERKSYISTNVTSGMTPYISRPSSSSAYHQHRMSNNRQHDPTVQSPLFDESTTSSVTATGIPSESQPRQSTGNRLLTDQQYTSVVALGPATKRALETLQSEIIALNDRIDGLRQELIDRDNEMKQTSASSGRSTVKKDEDDGEIWDAWEWVFKAALKHTTMNLMTIFLIVFFLYKRGNPIAYAFIGSLYKQWCTFKLGFLKNKLIL
ncbi:acyl CoA binding protein-domain-containing protein [Halteromyces radiatus]|uniref:acyl CoA binding protein-domain-containing protein n=1 Tax=Halteromyces radiatus TaxID=101107 RepID=UPI002220B656|nr:acyl CoA binding protein-domain-containing protein [Halteromyces radiatus]KAI8092493.1 acyl CoA binding protein-domain-containing protein [Halteromyces radiatus]